jgi:hypothetical protein
MKPTWRQQDARLTPTAALLAGRHAMPGDPANLPMVQRCSE